MYKLNLCHAYGATRVQKKKIISCCSFVCRTIFIAGTSFSNGITTRLANRVHETGQVQLGKNKKRKLRLYKNDRNSKVSVRMQMDSQSEDYQLTLELSFTLLMFVKLLSNSILENGLKEVAQ